MRLAYFSPLNPQPSGISDYSEELLPHLAAHAHIDLFVDGFEPSNEELRESFRVFDYRRDAKALSRLKDYDAVVYQMGNDHRYHAGILEASEAHAGGVVVLHDFALQDFFLGLARERADLNLYLEEVAYCHGEEARSEAAQALARGGAPSILARPLEFPLNCRLASRAEALIVHSEWSRERLRSIAPGVKIEKINMPINVRELDEGAPHVRADGRRGPVRIASFGLITPGKGIEQALRALAALKKTHDFRYALVGEPNSFFDVRGLISKYGLEDRVEITGYVSLPEFERRIRETDVALNMRERTVGETSASLCRIMQAGVAGVVSNVGWYAELPGDAVVKVDADEYSDALLLAYLRRLIEDADLRRRIGENARGYIRTHHRVEESAARYIAFIRETVEGRARSLFLKSVARDAATLGATDEDFLRGLSAELSALAPASNGDRERGGETHAGDATGDDHDSTKRREEGARLSEKGVKEMTAAAAAAVASASARSGERATDERSASVAPEESRAVEPEEASRAIEGAGAPRLRKLEGIDYKRAAREYPQKLDAERHHYLYTKPFYNLANKPPKHLGDGMDAETHRHFCDFANMSVALALPAGRRILDVGCGSGWLSEYLARMGYEVTGIDISSDLIEIARQRMACVPYDVDHETPALCRFIAHDIESGPLEETFDAVFCYDSLHHFEDERAVLRNISRMVAYGGLLFILEGGKPAEGSETEEELTEVMREYETLESPFDAEYLRSLVAEHGFLVVGDYVSVNGLFERETIEGGRVAFTPEDLNYLLCKKVVRDHTSAARVADSRAPRKLSARIALEEDSPELLAPAATYALPLAIENAGDTVWLTGPAERRGAVMLAARLFDEAGEMIEERHGEPPLPRALAPGESVRIVYNLRAPRKTGSYLLKIDLVAQHVAWFEQAGSEPLILSFRV